MSFTELERDVIDLPVFQRLRGLKQSSLAHLTYPTALTSRFEHSLGCAYVGGLIVEHLLRSSPAQFVALAREMRALHRTVLPRSIEGVIDQIHQGVRLACLLHDVGHLPFSHCFEHDFQDALKDPILSQRWGPQVLVSWKHVSENPRSSTKFHEFLGAMIAERNPGILSAARRHSARGAHTLALDILNPSRSPLAANSSLQLALGKIVHGEIDADRLDFVRRDPYMAGSGLGGFDIERLIRSLKLTKSRGHFVVRPSIQGLSALESFLMARLETYRWQYHHYNVIYHDLMLRLVVRVLLRRSPLIRTRIDLVADLSFDNLALGRSTSGARVPTIVVDDSMLLSRLGTFRDELSRRIARHPSLELARFLVMVDEILFRSKRRVVLWKDHNGYLAFADILRDEVARELARKEHMNIRDALPRTLKCWPESRTCVESILRPLRTQRSGGLEALQAWLWRNGCEWVVVDYREIEPFRRVGGRRAISAMEVITRAGETPSSRPFNELSSVLLGFGDDDGKEMRFFAYELLSPRSKRLERQQIRLKVDASRRRLARTMARWLFRAPRALENLPKSDREVLFGEDSTS